MTRADRHEGAASARTLAAPARSDEGLPGSLWAVLALAAPVLCGLGALALGKDFNWDFRNYHYYNPHALLHLRLGLDLAPAQLQSYHNALIDLPLYAMIQTLPPRLAGFLLGAVQGLNAVLVFRLYWSLSRPTPWRSKIPIAVAVSVLSCTAPAFVQELGTSYGDTLVSLFVLAALLAMVGALKASEQERCGTTVALVLVAGLVMGAGVGLKPTAGVFALGSAVALLAVVGVGYRGATALAVFCVAGVAGAALSGGYWAWTLWREFGNPWFPYFNQFFRISLIGQGPFVDPQFLSNEIWEYFVWPLVFSADSTRVSYLSFVDVRFVVLYGACVAWIARLAWYRLVRKAPAGTGNAGAFHRLAGTFLLLFMITAFVLWMLAYPLYRYIAALELLVPLCFLVIIDRFSLPSRVEAAVCITAALLVLVSFQPRLAGRASWDGPYVAVDAASHELADGALVVMLGDEPMAFVIPELPSGVRFVRPGGNLSLTGEHELYREMEAVIRDHVGPVYVMHGMQDDPERLAGAAAALGLRYDGGLCGRLRTTPPSTISLCRTRD